ncbi:MAG: hypothetical protein Q9212_007254, partial [Teloschistes hypoglaucus]
MVKGYGKKGAAHNLALQLQRLQISSTQEPIKSKKAIDEQNAPIGIENPDIRNRQPLVPIDPNVEINKHSNKGLPTFEGEQINQSLEKAQRETKSDPSKQSQTIKQTRPEKQKPLEKES